MTRTPPALALAVLVLALSGAIPGAGAARRTVRPISSMPRPWSTASRSTPAISGRTISSENGSTVMTRRAAC